MKTLGSKAPVAIGLILSLIASIGITASALNSQDQTQTSTTQTTEAPALSSIPKGETPGVGYNAGDLPPEITLDQALSDANVKVIVPKYLPANAKLDVARKSQSGSEYCITLNYDLGDDWIDVIAIKKPKPDYASAANPSTQAERTLPDGTKEKVTVNSGLVVATQTPDGTWEPVGVDDNSLVFVKGIPARYVESKGIGTVRMGKVPRQVPPRDFAAVSFWKDGVEYTVGGSDISKDELIKIAESMF